MLQENCRTFETLLPPVEHVIYLKRDTKFCISNIGKRGRKGENTISPEYLDGEFTYNFILILLFSPQKKDARKGTKMLARFQHFGSFFSMMLV